MTRGLALLVIAACGSKVPATRYYQLATPTKPAAGGTATLAIEPLVTDSAYDDERMVYRTTPYRLDYYQYHRWSSAPGELVGNYLEQAFEHSGMFHAVTRGPGGDAPVMLGGRVLAIEEVDASKQQWLGHVVLELTLTDTRTGEVVWRQQFDESEPMPAQRPEGLARALSVAMARIAERAGPAIADVAERQAQRHRERPAKEARRAP